MEAIRRREEADVLDACAEQQERLQEAKAAAATDPSPENLAAKRQAEQEMHEFRRWLRTNGRPVLPDGDGAAVAGADAQPARPAGRKRRDA